MNRRGAKRQRTKVSIDEVNAIVPHAEDKHAETETDEEEEEQEEEERFGENLQNWTQILNTVAVYLQLHGSEMSTDAVMKLLMELVQTYDPHQKMTKHAQSAMTQKTKMRNCVEDIRRTMNQE